MTTTPECAHRQVTKVIDRLGAMAEGANGKVAAPVLDWHSVCRDCGVTTEAHSYAEPRARLTAQERAFCWGGVDAESPAPGRHRKTLTQRVKDTSGRPTW